jgi:hypothetical protein
LVINYLPEDHRLAVQLRTRTSCYPEDVAVALLGSQVDHRQQAGLIVVQLVILVFEEALFPPDADLRFAVDPVGDEVASFDELFLYDFVETGLFVACGFAFPKILARAELSEVLGSLGAYIFEEFKAGPSDFEFVGVELKEDDWVVFGPDDACHINQI